MSFSAPGSPPPQPSYADHPQPAGPAYPVAPPPAAALRSPQGLATALTVLLSVAAAVNLLSAGAEALTLSVMRDLVAHPGRTSRSAVDLSDLLTGLAAGLQVLSLLGTAVVFVIWFHRVRCNGEVFRGDGFTQTSGWAIGGWFVPIGNLFIPFRIARQTWAASTQYGPDGSFRKVSSAPLTAWWILWTVSSVLGRVYDRLSRSAETPGALGDVALFGMVIDLVTVAAAVFAIVFVRRLTAMQRTRAVEGPYAAA